MLEQFYEVKTIFILTMNLWSCIADLILLSSAVSKDLSITTKEIFIRVSVLKKSNIGFFISFIHLPACLILIPCWSCCLVGLLF